MVQSVPFKDLGLLTENSVKNHFGLLEGSCGVGSIQGFVAPLQCFL